MLFVVLGGCVLMISLDLMPLVPTGRRRGMLDDPHAWQVSVVATAFLCAGATLLLPKRWTVLRRVAAACAVVSVAAPLGWMVIASPLSLLDRMLLAIPLMLAAVGLAVGAWRKLTGRSFDPNSIDAMDAARVLVAYGRTHEAASILNRAMEEQPGRRDELQRAIDAMPHHRRTSG